MAAGSSEQLPSSSLSFSARESGDEGEVVGEVVAAQPQAAALGDGAVSVEDVVGGTAADVDEQGSLFLGLAVEDDHGGGDRGEDNLFDFQGDFLDAADGILNAAADAVDDVVVGFQFAAEHAERIDHAVLAVHDVMADHAVEEDILFGDGDVAGDFLDFREVVLGDFVLVFGDAEAAAVVE